jgi:Domain of unknown function (DUF4158)
MPWVVPLGVCPASPSRGGREPAGTSPALQEPTTLHRLPYPHELRAERVVLTPAEQAQIARCRGPLNRLGFADPMGFRRRTGRLPTQQPLEILDDLLAFVAHEFALDPAGMQDDAQRQATVSAHQEPMRCHLGLRPVDAHARAARSRVHGLTCPHLQDACLRLDAQHTCKYERELVERRRLPRLLPSGRTVHTSDADLVGVSVHMPDVLFNAFGFVPHGRNDGRLLDQSCPTCLLMP